MTLRKLIVAIAVTGLVMGIASPNAYAGTEDKAPTNKGQRSAQLKNGETDQGTFAYRFDTYTNYSQGGGECSLSDPSCASSMNSDLGAGAYGGVGGIVKPIDKVKVKPVEVQKTTTPTND